MSTSRYPDSRHQVFAQEAGVSVDTLHVRSMTGFVQATSEQIKDQDVIDFFDKDGKHLGFYDGSAFPNQ